MGIWIIVYGLGAILLGGGLGILWVYRKQHTAKQDHFYAWLIAFGAALMALGTWGVS